MHLTKTIKSLIGLFILALNCLFVINVSAQQSEVLPPTAKDNVFKGTADLLKTVAIDVLKRDSVSDLSIKTAGKYSKVNQIHFKMIDSMARVLLQFPLQDSAGLPYAEDWVGTTNMGLRRPNFVIIHHTATNGHEEAIQEFTTSEGREASSHYLIGKDGTVYHMLNDLLRSHHAGESKWGNNTDLNSSSIGIEIVNNGNQAYTEEQINNLLILLGRIKAAYKIPEGNFWGHGDIATTRKVDPNAKFPWKELSEKGFGLWWDDTTNVQVPDNFDYLLGLRIIGYDISYPQSAVAAFKRHFMNDGSGGSMNAAVRKVIYALYRKYM